jgi:hypothetical protein
MAETNCVIVRTVGRQLDELRSQASRIAKGRKIDWWVDRSDKGTCFCFEDPDAKQDFASFCTNLGVPHIDTQCA